MTANSLSVERSEDVGEIVLDDPEGRNALDLDTANAFVRAAIELGNDPDVRCIVLTHTGDFFCTGADLTGFAGDRSDAATIQQLAGRLHEAIVLLHRAPKPVVGGIDGIAAGAGFGLALVPDVLLLSESARLEYAYPRIGLTGDCASTYFLPRLVGLRRAQEIALLDEPISASQALEDGIATEVVPANEFESRLETIVEAVATGPTKALGSISQLMVESFQSSLETQLAAETEAIGMAAGTTDYRRGYEAFFSDQDADFVGE